MNSQVRKSEKDNLFEIGNAHRFIYLLSYVAYK